MMAAMSNGEPIRDLRINGDYRHSGPQGMVADYQVNEIMAGFYGKYQYWCNQYSCHFSFRFCEPNLITVFVANANVRRDSFNTHQSVKMEPQAAQVTAEPRR